MEDLGIDDSNIQLYLKLTVCERVGFIWLIIGSSNRTANIMSLGFSTREIY
jgi:hypothetical protein